MTPGNLRSRYITGTPLPPGQGALTASWIRLHDAEHSLRRNERLAEMGELAAAIGHELRGTTMTVELPADTQGAWRSTAQ